MVQIKIDCAKSLTFGRDVLYTYLQIRSTQTTKYAQRYLLSSREVEGNGPMKPGNPPATVQEGCQFRRNSIVRKMRGIAALL